MDFDRVTLWERGVLSGKEGSILGVLQTVVKNGGIIIILGGRGRFWERRI